MRAKSFVKTQSNPIGSQCDRMILALACFSVLQMSPKIDRDAYGVPHIVAATIDQAFFEAGYAVAQDRLWQMENSRRLARGRLAEAFGPRYIPSDREILTTGYTDRELDMQFEALPASERAEIQRYVDGVNAWIDEATEKKSLPQQYAENDLKPEPWTTTDSIAITVRLFRIFGTGGAGQLRNMAVLAYLDGQPNAKNRKLDVLDDFLWQNDPEATPTVRPEDDPLARNHYEFPKFDRATSIERLANLPKANLFELLPGLSLALSEVSKTTAQTINVPFKTGSYCVVVSPKRSAVHYPILMSGPQMGFSTPSIVHEISMDAPEMRVSGMDVPGVPGVAIGATPNFAWGLTSGVAPTDDIFYFKTDGKDGYRYGAARKALEVVKRVLKIKGRADEVVEQRRTLAGPVLISTQSGYLFARKSSYWMREAQGLDAVLSLPAAKNADEIEAAFLKAPVSFNAFYATTTGDIGWRYIGAIPKRADGLDPRLPTPGEPKYDWKGMIPPDQMPHQRNPKSGLIANWNNKPAAWWPNLDTPIWGKIFRNSAILTQLTAPAISVQQVESTAWGIARMDEDFPYFEPYFKLAATRLGGDSNSKLISAIALAYDGRTIDGSQGASLFLAWKKALREELFVGAVGNFVSPDLFQTAAQPTVMLRALERKTVVDYLRGRKSGDVAVAAMNTAVSRLTESSGTNPADWRFKAPGIRIDAEVPIPYSNRGTYIQILELAAKVSGRNVMPPGESEFGPHAHDQSPLSRAWIFKPMWLAFGG